MPLTQTSFRISLLLPILEKHNPARLKRRLQPKQIRMQASNPLKEQAFKITMRRGKQPSGAVITHFKIAKSCK
jgi:hypothetical protein